MSISNMIKGFVNGEEIAYVKNGLVLKGVTMQEMVGSEDDLVNLPEDIMPGSVAFTAGYSSMWQKAADGSWEEISQESGGGGGGGMKLTLTVTDEVSTLDATYAQVKAALLAGTEVFFVYVEGGEVTRFTLTACEDGNAHDPNFAYFVAGSNGMTFTADTEDALLTDNLGG